MSVNYFEVLLARMERMQSTMKALMPSHGYARVVTVSPLVVETEQQPTELPASTVAPRLEVNDRVWFIRYLGRVMVVGKAGGFDVPAPASQAEVDAGVDNENYVTPKTLADRLLIQSGTITAQSTINIDGLTGFDRYEVTLILPTSSTANDLTAQLRASGVTNTTANYDRQITQGDGTVTVSARYMGKTSWGTTQADRTSKTVTILLHNLNESEPTFADLRASSWDATSNSAHTVSGLRHRASTSFDGVRFTTTTGTVTGRFEVRAV